MRPSISGLDNPLLDHYERALEHLRTCDAKRFAVIGKPSYYGCARCGQLESRTYDMQKKLSWVVPTEEALGAIATYSPHGVVEVGAGPGYWARLLTNRGVDVVAFDRSPPSRWRGVRWNVYHPRSVRFFPVKRGGPENVADYPQRSLFLCSPPKNVDMASTCLRAYLGHILIYAGEEPGGVAGDDAFHATVQDPDCWTEVASIALPQWSGCTEGMRIYRRP